MKVLVADDHELVRDMLAAFLEREGDFDLTTCSDYGSAAEAIRGQGPFDLVLLDYQMPGMRGLDSLAEAMSLNAPLPVALMSGTADKRIAECALKAGAAGFVPKSMPARSLVHAVRFMLAGEQYAPIAFMTAPEVEDAAHPLAQKLSPRELEVLEGLCNGQANKEIARDLGLAEVTVKLHVRTLGRKLGARNRTHAAMIAKEAGMF
ncbi:DNA-binding response regulator [Acuticoccus sediminis]|uniref:DNA-binding response regulator n=1 Tax=Acuticoccus sediminis TaxID=2184697 RepID=A0A8B2NLQ0_9HYPH|nr:response regulator transcription factor [Acuticoccus sediminis]RAI00527.1 DNA-binding response regulator [Acuticoccus sediminis]